MKAFSGVFFSALLLASVIGCNKSQPGGGADRTHKFTLTGPVMTTSIRQGETQTMNIGVSRGTDFKNKITFTTEPPAGIDVTVDPNSVGANEKRDVQLKASAKPTASLGEHTIRVIATPENGTATTLDVKVKVTEGSIPNTTTATTTKGDTNNANTTTASKGDSVTPKNSTTTTEAVKGAKTSTIWTWKAPAGTVVIKQGDTQTVPLTMDGDKRSGAVNAKVEAPKGISVELTPTAIQPADRETRLKLTVDKTAPLGEHIIHVTSDNTSMQALDLKVKVVAPDKESPK